MRFSSSFHQVSGQEKPGVSKRAVIEGSLGWDQFHPLEDMTGLNSCSLLPVLLSLFLWQLHQQWWQPGCDLWALLGEQGTQPCVGSWGQEQPGSSCGGTGTLLRRATV